MSHVQQHESRCNKLPARVITCTVLYIMECVILNHSDLSTPELSNIAWDLFRPQYENNMDSPKLTIETI